MALSKPRFQSIGQLLAYNALAVDTIKKYDRWLLKYTEFCNSKHVNVFPLDIDTIVEFLMPSLQAKKIHNVEALMHALMFTARWCNYVIPDSFNLYFKALKKLSTNIHKRKREVVLLSHDEVMTSLQLVWDLPDSPDKFRTLIGN